MTATVKTEKATVAPGRTLSGPDGETYGPGAEVELAVAEVKELRAAGFLVDPKAEAVKRGNGPNYSGDRRPTVKRVGQ
ncbi:hypothetical protein NUJ30_08415 [Burkholderia contaminans]|uniref:hypothetical protein n=1 Tax=Burkholderia TaxID=32008 RepID=UPI0010F661CD|nr:MULTISPECIES: hypothetical protein [Burkholderia]MBD1412862.1 hypothetical protein [Burkholderia contaminans]UXZ68687.1 hypothetical protein NUJ29_08420 [Burkholderia contaminans]UXZ76448.1 hypothetical protein NUJ30_08415 [Burkholderia contaminans]